MTEKEKQEMINRQRIEQYLKKMSKMPNSGLPKDGKGGFYNLLEQQQRKKQAEEAKKKEEEEKK